MVILDGKQTSDILNESLAKKISEEKGKITLMMIVVGSNPASAVYVRNKERACEKVGIKSVVHRLDENATQKEVLDLIRHANSSNQIHGIMVQMPLPKHIDETTIINEINPLKDVDGLTLHNQGLLFTGCDGLFPATPKGILTLLKTYAITLTGKHCVIVGRSKLVGKPVGMLMLNNNATVTYAHSKTENLKAICKSADVLIVAVGKAHFITSDMVKKDAVVIDVGINRLNDKLTGDVDFESVSKVASYITPVPKGVGPMTVYSLLENTYEAYLIQKNLNK